MVQFPDQSQEIGSKKNYVQRNAQRLVYSAVILEQSVRQSNTFKMHFQLTLAHTTGIAFFICIVIFGQCTLGSGINTNDAKNFVCVEQKTWNYKCK